MGKKKKMRNSVDLAIGRDFEKAQEAIKCLQVENSRLAEAGSDEWHRADRAEAKVKALRTEVNALRKKAYDLQLALRKIRGMLGYGPLPRNDEENIEKAYLITVAALVNEDDDVYTIYQPGV